MRSTAAALFLLAIPAIAQHPAPGEIARDPSEVAQAVAHYARVERELRAADVGPLTEAQSRARAHVVELLRRYRETADFGINAGYPGARKPYFVDDAGRRCAVAYLLDHTGSPDLTLDVARTNNHAWIADLRDDARLARWLEQNGLSLTEAARIQFCGCAPQGEPGDIQREAEAIAALLDDPWITPDAPDVPAPTGDPATARPSDPTTPAAARGTSGLAGARGVPITALGTETWNAWWTYNRPHYLRPRIGAPLAVDGSDLGGDQLTRAGGDFRIAGRVRAMPLLRQALEHDAAAVRAAATTAIGRVGGRDVVPDLIARLDDPHQGVRHHAILALGAVGTPNAVHNLSRIARDGHLRGARARDRATPISPLARPLAIVALGLARGRNAAVDGLVHAISRELDAREGRGGHDGRRVAQAALLYEVLTSSDRLVPFARRIATDDRAELALRSRAIESLAVAAEGRVLVDLMNLLAGRKLEARRSAALSLGASTDPLALPGLMTAFEDEREPLARAFAMLAIGRHDAPAARDFLLEQLQDGKKSLRAWAALGLGRWAREHGDPVVRRAIRTAYDNERNRDAKGAYLIAMGIARDRAAIHKLTTVLARSKNPTLRSNAAEALAMIGGDDVRDAIRSRLESEIAVDTRAILCEVLGFVGEPADAALVVDQLRFCVLPGHRARLAVALAQLQHPGSLRTLESLATDADEPTLLQAAAIQSIGLLLARRESHRVAQLGADANFTVFPGWVRAVLSTTL